MSQLSMCDRIEINVGAVAIAFKPIYIKVSVNKNKSQVVTRKVINRIVKVV